MVDLVTLAAFIPAVAVVVAAPGPDTIYTLTQSLGRGRTAGVVAATGTATGVLIHTTAAVLGLAALLQASVLAYTVVKYVGAAYLVYLGITLLRSQEEFETVADLAAGDSPLRDSYRRAVVINVTNPKVAVFVLAFFPQFVPPAADATVQMTTLGLVYAGISLLYLAGVALFASRVRQFLLDSAWHQRLIRYASGSLLVGFGLALALEHSPPT